MYLKQYELVKIKTDFKSMKISNPDDANKFSRNFYGNDLLIYESAYCFTLNKANNTTGFVKIGQGGVSSTIVDEKLILKYALESLASSIIIVHNHPSGNKLPSEHDKEMSRKIHKYLKEFGINLLDFLIITEDDYFSFMDNGLL